MRYAHQKTFQRGTPDLSFACCNFHCAVPLTATANIQWHPKQEILYAKTGSIWVLIGKNVFVNDPATGYGIFIEYMLDAAA